MAELSDTSLVFVIFGCISWAYALTQCLLFARCCGRCRGSEDNTDTRWATRGHISSSVPASAPRSAPLHVKSQRGGFTYDRFIATVAAFDLTKRVLGQHMDSDKTVENALSNNTSEQAPVPVIDAELERQLALLEQYFGDGVHGSAQPHASTELLVRDGVSLMNTPVMQQQSAFCVPFAFLWVGLALWPWVQLQEDCVAANEADCDTEASASANEIAFIVMASVFGCCSCFFLMADMEFLSRVRPWSEYSARLNKLTQLGDSPEGCKLDTTMTWRARHPSGEQKDGKAAFVDTGTGRVRVTDDTGLRFVTRSTVSDMRQLEERLKQAAVPGAYVHLNVEFVPRGMATRYLSTLRTLGAALGARVDTHFDSAIEVHLHPDASKAKEGSDKDLKLRTGAKVQSTLVLLPDVSKEQMASYVEPFGWFHPFPRFFLQLITLALGLNTLIAGCNTRKLPQAVVTLRKELWLTSDPDLPPESTHSEQRSSDTEKHTADACTASGIVMIPGLPPGMLPPPATPSAGASAPQHPHGTTQVTVNPAAPGVVPALSPPPYSQGVGGAPPPYGAPPSTGPQPPSGVTQSQVAAWQAMLPPPAYGGAMFAPPAGGGAFPPPYHSQPPPPNGPSSRVTQAFGLSWTPPPGEAGDFYV